MRLVTYGIAGAAIFRAMLALMLRERWDLVLPSPTVHVSTPLNWQHWLYRNRARGMHDA